MERTDNAVLTPDQRVRVFVSSTIEELAAERAAVREAVERLHLSPILFELGARAHPPRSLYRSYLEQSHVFVGIYWQRYGWIAPEETVSGLEDEYLLATAKPKLIYVKRPAPERDPRLEELLNRIRDDDDVSYKGFSSAEELHSLVADDLSMLLSESFLDAGSAAPAARQRFTLPAETTMFVGRAAELAELHALLTRDDVRMVTLTGPGGIGKTRLALRAAAHAAPLFDEGAAYVPLGSVRDPQLLASAMATGVGLRDSSGSVEDALKADLAERSLLLVIDNFEHLMPAADLLPELLAHAPRVKVLVTSREALRVQAEHEFSVPPFALADSVRMFTDRATAVRRDFHVDAANAETVNEICKRLEGIPLAIELAAARTRLLSLDALLERLQRRLDFLVGGARDLPQRQQALRSTIEWSHDLLDEAERRMFATLGVFVGGFSLAAAEHVGAAVEAHGDVLELLASLVDKSLLRVEPTAGEPRFRMLDMIAEYAREQLARSDDAERVHHAHAAFYRQLSDEFGAATRGPDQGAWLSMLGGEEGSEAGNFGAALSWYQEHGDLDAFADMAWALWLPAWISGRIDEGRTLARAALDAPGTASERSRGRLLVVFGLFGMWSGAHDEAAAALREGYEMAVAVGDDEAAAAADLAVTMIIGPTEGEARAEEAASRSLATFERRGDLWGQAAALNVLGWLYVTQERFDGNEATLRAALATSIASGDQQFIAMAEVNVAEHVLHEGNEPEATELLASGVGRHRSLRLMYSVAYLLDSVAHLAAHEQNPTAAARLVGAASHLRATAGVSVWGSQLERRNRFVDQLRADLGDKAFATAHAAGEQLSYADALDEATQALQS
jgi:predicted ATPase